MRASRRGAGKRRATTAWGRCRERRGRPPTGPRPGTRAADTGCSKVDQSAEQQAADDGHAPRQGAPRKEPRGPGRVGHAGHEVVGEDEGWPGGGGLLREQVPGGVAERGENHEGNGGKRHETSGRRGGARLISTSPPLGFYPSGAAAASPQCPQRSDLRRPRTTARNPSCHSVDGIHLDRRPAPLSIRPGLLDFTHDRVRLPRSTVTEAIKQLEARLGVRLLQRTTRHVAPTIDGEAYYRRCLAILADVEGALPAPRPVANRGPRLPRALVHPPEAAGLPGPISRTVPAHRRWRPARGPGVRGGRLRGPGWRPSRTAV